MKVPVTPTWRNTKRPFLRRVQWGVLVGSADVFAGLVNVISLGQFASWLPLEVACRLSLAEAQRAKDAALDGETDE